MKRSWSASSVQQQNPEKRLRLTLRAINERHNREQVAPSISQGLCSQCANIQFDQQAIKSLTRGTLQSIPLYRFSDLALSCRLCRVFLQT